MQSAATLISSTRPDLVFLDIEMPNGNAFELLNNVVPVNFEIIFVTAFDNYALHAIKYSALDYLLKPVNIKELQDAVKKAEERIKVKNIARRIDTLLYNIQANQSSYQRMALPTMDGFIFMDTVEFVRLEANNNYTIIHLSNNNKVLVARSLKEFEELLPPQQFSRIHNSHIVNHDHIRKYHRGRGGYIEMENGTMLEVSTRKKDEFLSKFK